jgi:hypothetical protein
MRNGLDHSNMIALARPARLRQVLIMIICTPFLGVFAWVGPEVASDFDVLTLADVATLAGLMILLSSALFPFTRNLQALFARPHFLANKTEIALRHWGGYWSLLLPFLLVRQHRIRWSDILSVSRKWVTINFITAEDYAILHRSNGKEVHIHRGVFDRSIDAITNLIEARIARDAAEDAFPAGQAQAHAQRLGAHFAMPLEFHYSPRFSRLLGLIVGPPVGFVGARWLFENLGENTILDYAIALASCGATGWLIFAIDEAVRSFGHRSRNFWFRGDGLATGANESTAELHPWRNVLGAHRRVKRMRDQWDKPRAPHLDGLDILLRDGRTLWIPEQYSDDLDDLHDVLQFEGQPVPLRKRLTEMTTRTAIPDKETRARR